MSAAIAEKAAKTFGKGSKKWPWNLAENDIAVHWPNGHKVTGRMNEMVKTQGVFWMTEHKSGSRRLVYVDEVQSIQLEERGGTPRDPNVTSVRDVFSRAPQRFAAQQFPIPGVEAANLDGWIKNVQ